MKNFGPEFPDMPSRRRSEKEEHSPQNTRLADQTIRLARGLLLDENLAR